MTHIRVMGTLVCCTRVSVDCSDLLGTIYAINHIHCTHQKLNVHNGIANRQHTSRKLNIMGCKTLAIDRAEFIVTDLEKYTSYEDEINSSVELKESSNFHADFNCTAKL